MRHGLTHTRLWSSVQLSRPCWHSSLTHFLKKEPFHHLFRPKSWVSTPTQTCKIQYLYSVCASCTYDGVPWSWKVQQFTQVWLGLLNLCNSEMVTSNHNTRLNETYGFWIIYTVKGTERDDGPTIAHKPFFSQITSSEKEKPLFNRLSVLLDWNISE